MKVLLLSAYAARSHVHWQQTLQSMFPQWQWCVLSLPPRHFSWRVRGNALYWALSERQVLEGGHDLLIATSMVDLATLRGLVPALARIPAVLYFHENQFAYPQHRQQYPLLEAQITSIYSALAADCVLFNSSYNRASFLEGCTQLLRKMPDCVPPGVVPALQAKSQVLAVPVDLPPGDTTQPYWPGATRLSKGHPLRLVWVGRFEHDKGGEGLLRILQLLEDQALEYELALVGQQFRQSPAVFTRIRDDFAHRIVHCGYIESFPRYQGLLREADIVLSTALHEFQGVSVMEAVLSGCIPVVPDRLVYPEVYPARFRYDSHVKDTEREAHSAATLILEVARNLPAFLEARPDMSAYGARQLAFSYRRIFERLVNAPG